jgi:hypothetical protein
MEQLGTNFIVNAEQAIDVASAELQRPNEDVVAFVVCNNAANAVRYLLQSYLAIHHVPFGKGTGLNELIALCKKHNPYFGTFNFDPFKCKAYNIDSQHYCLDVKRVSECLDLAVQLRNFIRKDETNGSN